MGRLSILPPEILDSILNMLDLENLTHFRAISSRSRASVDNVSSYNGIIQHCPNALRALLSTQMATHFTPQDIFETLCTPACSGCGKFGPFLDMFTARRYCFRCIKFSDDLLTMTVTLAKTEFALTSKAVRALPTLLSIPGMYSDLKRWYKRRFSLVRITAASALPSAKQHDSHLLLGGPGESTGAGALLHCSPELLQYINSKRHRPYRFMAVLRFPHLDRPTGILDWGVFCQACRLAPKGLRRACRDWRTFYSASGYMEHFQKCEASQMGRAVAHKYTYGDYWAPIWTPRFLRYLTSIKL